MVEEYFTLVGVIGCSEVGMVIGYSDNGGDMIVKC